MTTETNHRAERLRQAILAKQAAVRPSVPLLPLRPADEPAVLGEMQRGLWLFQQLDPHAAAYNLSSAFRVQGALDVARLERAVAAVVARHRLLRSTFRAHRGTVLQQVQPHLPVPVEVLAVEDGEGPARMVEEAKIPFDLAQGPLLRLRIFEEASGQGQFLLLVLHHILADERSLAFLWQELAEAYDVSPVDVPPVDVPLADVPLADASLPQYDDYVCWCAQRDPREEQRDLDFWRRRLDPLPETLQLPFEKAPTVAADAGRAAPGRFVERSLEPAVQQGIRRLAAAASVTPFMVTACAFRLLLQRTAAGQPMAFATPISTRSHPATARMIGYFTNLVVVATAVDEERPVGAALEAFCSELREALGHASISFQRLTEDLAPPRQHGRQPLVQALFVYQETSPPPPFGGVRLQPLPLDLGASKFDLTLFVTEAVTEGVPRLSIAVEYRTDRFDPVWMEQLLGHYATLLEQLPVDLGRSMAQVPMLRAEELRQLEDAAQGDTLEVAMALLPQQILDQARRAPQAPAVQCGDVGLSYGELEGLGRSIAARLASQGVRSGDRVALFLDRSVLLIASLLGSHWVGAAYVPLDPSYPEARNREILEDAEVAAVLTTSALRHRLPVGSWAVLEGDLAQNPQAAEFPAVALPEITPESIAYLLYTSGSTGRPKGVVVSHHNLRLSTAARLQAYDLAPRRFLLLSSIAFDSSVAGLFWTLAVGGTLVIPTDDEAGDPRRLARCIAARGVDSLLCVPSLYAHILAADGALLQGLEFAIVAGESCPAVLLEEHFRTVPQARLFNEYGPTEATVWATLEEFKPRDAAGPVTIGRPIAGVRVEVLDRFGRTLPRGIPGQAWIVGPTVAQGYWRRPDLTSERFSRKPGAGVDERCLRTGDRMAWTADGRLLFLGREDEQIKLRGLRVEPGEIEALLLDFPEIEQAAVVARPRGSASTSEAIELVAFLTLSESSIGSEGSPRAVESARNAVWRQGLAGRLPAHLIPRRLVVLPALPSLPNGKVDRQRLRDLALEATAGVGEVRGGEEAWVPSTHEQALLALWEGLLGRSGIGPRDNFFELGGHSLLVAQMTQAIEENFEVSLFASEVFENPTVVELTRRIAHKGGATAPPYQHLFPIQPTGRGMPLIFAVPHFFTQTFAERFRGERPVYGLRGVSLRAEGNRGRWRTMTDLGEDLVEEIRRRFPDESYIMAGYSFGASMAIEAVRVMEARGIPVHLLLLIAPMPVDGYRFGPFRVQLDGLRKATTELSTMEALRLFLAGNNPLTRRPYQRVWRLFTVQAWRRVLCYLGDLRALAGLPRTPRILHADVRLERFRLHGQYRPGPVSTPTVLFNAQETATDAAATWRPCFQGPFTVHPTPDPHLGEDSVEAARQVILEQLRNLGRS